MTKVFASAFGSGEKRGDGTTAVDGFITPPALGLTRMEEHEEEGEGQYDGCLKLKGCSDRDRRGSLLLLLLLAHM